MKTFVHVFIFLMAISLIACNSTSDSSAEGDAATAADSVAIEETPTVESEPSKPALRRGQNVPFEETLKDGNISFTVSSPNVDINTLVIFSKGLEVRNDTFQIEIEGIVNKAEIADINQDGYPEVYVFTQQKEAEEKGNVYVFTSYRNRSYGQAFLREQPRANNLNAEAITTDKYDLENDQLVRKIGNSSEGDQVNNNQRQTIIYTLKAGEASYQLLPQQ